jgi:predicted dehydrogenase
MVGMERWIGVAAGAVPHVHAAEDNTIRVALVGCGSRGTGAAAQVLQTKGPIKLRAMADLFPSRLEASLKNLAGSMERRYDLDPFAGLGDRIDVPPERRFIGFDADKKIWSFPPPEPSPYQMEMNDLVDAIRQDKPYNEAENGTMACLVAAMGRMAAHTGRVVTRDEMLNHKHEFAPGIDKLTLDSPSPLQAGRDGTYPGPQPGTLTNREY